MAPPFVVPQANPLIDPLVSWPSRLIDEPPGTEGRLIVPLTIKWSDYGLTAISVDCQQAQGPAPISRLVAIWIDATQSDADVTILCNDMKTSVTQPARTQGLQPLSTQALNFVVSSPQAIAADIVNIQVFNYKPDYVEILPPYLQTASVITSYDLHTALSPVNIVPFALSGILTGLNLRAFGVVGGAAAGTYQFLIVDGSPVPVTIASAGMSHAAGLGPDDQTVLSVTNLNVRFKSGVQLQTSVTGAAFAAGSFMDITAYFR